MGNVKWQTPAQDAFLKANVAGYEAAQVAQNLKVANAKKAGLKKNSDDLDRNEVTVFLNKFFLRWFLQFDNQSRTNSGTTTVDGEDNSVEGVKKKIRSWFNNHTGARNDAATKKPKVAKIHTSGKAPRDPFATLLLQGGANRPKQKLQPAQAFAEMLEDTPMKDEIKALWVIKTKADKSLLTTKGAYLKFYTEEIGLRYAKASEEMKAKVETYREEQHQKEVETSTQPPLLLAHEEHLPAEDQARIRQIRTMQRAIENLNYVCECFANTVNRLTNANVLVHVQGPEPANNAVMHTTSVTVGSRISDGKDIYEAHPQ
ncbi:hypothetical protein SCHPADRAFT_896644, partial [Schizopora paradoxa]